MVELRVSWVSSSFDSTLGNVRGHPDRSD
jgi:hypothetical protein